MVPEYDQFLNPAHLPLQTDRHVINIKLLSMERQPRRSSSEDIKLQKGIQYSNHGIAEISPVESSFPSRRSVQLT